MRPARMGLTLCGLLVLAGFAPRAAEPAKKDTATRPPWQRLLRGEDARKASELAERLEQLQMSGKFEDALKVAESLAALRKKVQGGDHWEAADAHWEVEALRRVLRADKESRADYSQRFALRQEARALKTKGHYRKAQPLHDKLLAIYRKVLGEDQRPSLSPDTSP